MKKYNIAVNGTSYEVVVEEIKNTRETTYLTKEPQSYSSSKSSNERRDVANSNLKTIEKCVKNNSDITAPMPGTINNVIVKVGDNVKRGDTLIILEAMKMENKIKSPLEGRISNVFVNQGDKVNTGDVLVMFN